MRYYVALVHCWSYIYNVFYLRILVLKNNYTIADSVQS